MNDTPETLIQLDFIRKAFSWGGNEAHHGTNFGMEMNHVNHEDGVAGHAARMQPIYSASSRVSSR